MSLANKQKYPVQTDFLKPMRRFTPQQRTGRIFDTLVPWSTCCDGFRTSFTFPVTLTLFWPNLHFSWRPAITLGNRSSPQITVVSSGGLEKSLRNRQIWARKILRPLERRTCRVLNRDRDRDFLSRLIGVRRKSTSRILVFRFSISIWASKASRLGTHSRIAPLVPCSDCSWHHLAKTDQER